MRTIEGCMKASGVRRVEVLPMPAVLVPYPNLHKLMQTKIRAAVRSNKSIGHIQIAWCKGQFAAI